MKKKLKTKFQKAIKSLEEVLNELNSGDETWELRYNESTYKFHLLKRDSDTPAWEIIEECSFDYR